MKFCSILPAGLPICAEYRCNRSLIAATGQPQQVCAALFKSQSLSRDGPDNVAQRYGRYAERNHSEYEYTHQSIVTGSDSAQPSSRSVRLRASRRSERRLQHRSSTRPIRPMHECHAKRYRDPRCKHLRLLTAVEMTGAPPLCGGDAPVQSPTVRVYVPRTAPIIFRTTSSVACAWSCACLPDCCSEVPLGFDLDQQSSCIGIAQETLRTRPYVFGLHRNLGSYPQHLLTEPTSLCR